MTIPKEITNIILDKSLKKHQKLSSILHFIFVKQCNISQDKYYILGSFAIREHRTISDLDINIDIDEFLKLENAVKNNIGHIEFYNGQIRWTYDLTNEYNRLTNQNEKDFSIEAFQKNPNVGFPNNNFSLNQLLKNGLDTDENGHQFFSITTLLLWKKTMNREKDKPDIELIENIINKKGGKSKKMVKKASKKMVKKVSKKASKKTVKKA